MWAEWVYQNHLRSYRRQSHRSRCRSRNCHRNHHKAATAKASTTIAAAETTAAGPAAATAAADTGTGTAVTKEQIIDDVPKSGRLICSPAAAAEAIGKNRGNARKHYCNRANN